MTERQQNTPMGFLVGLSKEAPTSPAILMKGRELTYGELYDEAGRRASYFRGLGIGPGSMVALYTDNELEFNISLFALWGLRAVCIPLNISQPEDKIRLIEKIVTPDFGLASAEATPLERDFPVHPISPASEEVYEPLELEVASPEERAMVMFTSGTSGVPKAVPMTYEAIARNASNTAKRLRLTTEDRILINTPPYFTSPIIHVLTMFSAGASVVVDRGFFFGASIFNKISEYNCTGFGGVPVHFLRLRAVIAESAPPEKLRFIMNSGEHLPVPVIEGIRAAAPGLEIYCVYGLTEVAGRLCSLEPEMLDKKPGSVGTPLEGMKITIRNEQGQEFQPGNQGHVFVEGPCLMSGYLNNEDANNKSMTEYGFATGDLGYMDGDGYLYLMGRQDDIIKVGGEKVSIKMIEEAVHGVEFLEDFMVSPEYDDALGTIPVLLYQLKEGEKFKRKVLVRHLAERLPSTHMPLRFTEVDEIPRSASGKISRNHGK